MIASAEQMPVCWRCRRLTQTLIWTVVIILHGLALWVFARQAVFDVPVPQQEQPLLVSWVAEAPAAGSQAAGQSAALKPSASAAPRQPAPQQAVPNKKTPPKPQETIAARPQPTAPVAETVTAAKPAESATDNGKATAAAKTVAVTGSGDGKGAGSGGGNQSGDGNGDGKAASGGGTLTVSAAQLRFRYRAPPVYSSVAQERGYRGVARVMIVVDQRGQLQQAAISRSSGYAMLDEAALSAARKSSFYPHVVNGVAHTVRAVIGYNFSLSRSPAKAPPTETTEESS